MSDKNYIKKEYYNKLLCCACLSADRALSPPGKLLKIYQNIVDNSYVDGQTEIHLCWECIAVLKKIKLFKEKVKNAQSVLTYYNFDKKILPPCLSNLTVTQTHTRMTIRIKEKDTKSTILVTEKQIGHETELEADRKPIDIKLESELKPENEDEGYDFDDTQTDYTYLEDLKSESQTLYKEIKKLDEGKGIKKETPEKAQRTLKYKMIRNSTKNLLRRVTIGQVELNAWRDRVRNSSYYKKLKSKCDKCICRYSLTALEVHNKTYHDKSIGPYTCGICESYFASKAALVKHVRCHYRLLECKACGHQSYTKERFWAHVKCHQRTVRCVLCGACYSTARKFFEHYKAMHTAFYCDQCGKKCSTKRSIEKHMRNRHDIRCGVCKAQFKEMKSLKAHAQLKHVLARSEAAFCVLCDRQFDNEAVYRRHVRTSVAHAPERNYRGLRKNAKVKCPECEKVYKRKQYMVNHYRHVHMRASGFYCKDCDKSFLNRTRYSDHMKYVHEGQVREKNKLCTVCGRGFNQTRTLVNHMRTHTGEKPYECPHCGARFAQRTAMLTHVKYIHMKERRKGAPYAALAQ